MAITARSDYSKLLQRVSAAKWKVKVLSSNLTLVYDPALTLANLPLPSEDLARLDDRNMIRFADASPDLQKQLKAEFSAFRRTLGETQRGFDPSTKFAFSSSRTIIFQLPDREVSIDIDPPVNFENYEAQKDSFRWAEDAPDASRRNDAESSSIGPLTLELMTLTPAIYTERLRLVTGFILQEAQENEERRERECLKLFAKLAKGDSALDPAQGANAKTFDSLPTDLRNRLQDHISSNFETYGFSSAEQALSGLRSSTISGQFARVNCHFYASGPNYPTGALFGFQIVPSSRIR